MLVINHDRMLSLAVDGLPIIRKPVGRILKADQNEELESHLLSFGHHVIGFAPIEHSGRFLDFIPNKLGAHGVGIDFLELNEIVFELVRGLIRSYGRIPGLIRNAVRNEVFECVRIPEISIAHLQNAAFGLTSRSYEQMSGDGCEQKSCSDESA